MKKLLLLAAMLMIGATMLKAQDTIVLRNGDELRAKVTEVNDMEIKYKLWANQDGPIYTKKVSEIFMVKYKGGHRDVYGIAKQQHSDNDMFSTNSNYVNDNGGGYMVYSQGDLILNDRKLNSFQVKEILGVSGYNTYSSALSQRRAGKINLIIGCVELGVSAFFSGLSIALEDEDFFIYGGLIPLGMSQIQLPLGFVLNGIGSGRLNWLADSYNNSHTYSDNFSLGFSPTLVCAPDAAGNRTFNLGARVSLNF